MGKILLCSPINIVKKYCLYEWLDHIKKLTYPDIEIFIVDNTINTDFSKEICELGFNCVWEKSEGMEARHFMANSLERCRIKFLAGDYTHFFSLECDIFPPLDIIERLLKHDLEVVSTTYWTNHGYETRLQLQTIYNLHTDIKTKTKEFKVRYLTFEEAQLFMDGQCKPVYANGIGCCLIKREILQHIQFRIDPADVGFADSFFHRDIWELGIDNYVDTSIIPLHKNSNWNTVISDTEHKILQVKRGDMKLK